MDYFKNCYKCNKFVDKTRRIPVTEATKHHAGLVLCSNCESSQEEIMD